MKLGVVIGLLAIAFPLTKGYKGCITECDGMMLGEYHYCRSCNSYIACSLRGEMVYECPVQDGAQLEWDDDRKQCVPESPTCNPIQCEVSEWSEWGECSGTCASSARTRVRTIEQRPWFGGEPCPNLIQRESCQCADECFQNTVFQDANRNICFEGMDGGTWLCDNDLAEGWYRFSGVGGTVMAEFPVPGDRCATRAPGWLDGEHPTGFNIRDVRVCFPWAANNCNWQTTTQVRHCGDYYVYRLRRPPSCNLRYCTAADGPQGPC